MYNILKNSALIVIACLFLVQTASASNHAENEGSEVKTEEKEKLDIMGHVMDAHDWHFFTIGHDHYSVPLPVILYSTDKGLEVMMSSAFHHHGEVVIDSLGHKYYHYKGYKMDEHAAKIKPIEDSRSVYDFSITKNVASMFLSVFFLCFIFFSVARSYRKNVGKAPKGMQSFFEPLIVYVRDEIAKPNIGDKHFARFMPLLLTIFFFIWFNNLLGLVPGGANVTGNIAVTVMLAVLVVIVTIFNGKKVYWLHIFDPLGNSMPVMAKIPLYIILIPIEIIGIFTKPFSLAVRLFANITAGHIIILSLLGLTFIGGSYFVGGAATLFAGAMSLLELFVAILQAYVFTMLTAMYIGQAVAEGHH